MESRSNQAKQTNKTKQTTLEAANSHQANDQRSKSASRLANLSQQTATAANGRALACLPGSHLLAWVLGEVVGCHCCSRLSCSVKPFVNSMGATHTCRMSSNQQQGLKQLTPKLARRQEEKENGCPSPPRQLASCCSATTPPPKQAFKTQTRCCALLVQHVKGKNAARSLPFFLLAGTLLVQHVQQATPS